MANKKRALGKGLSALLSATEDESQEEVRKDPAVLGATAEIPIDLIATNPYQPRTHFDEEALEELAQSIRVHGVIQPITVRKTGSKKFELISGERRYRASQKAGLEHIPAYIRVANDQTMLEMALVENIQRQDLDAIEVALSYQRLIDEIELTQEALADRVAKKRVTVTNYLRLLKLPVEIQKGIRNKSISMGHARALINVKEEGRQLEIFNLIGSKGLSVRQAEQLAKASKTATKSPVAKGSKNAELSFEQQKHQIDLERILNRKVSIRITDDGKGKLAIPFDNDADLTKLLDLLNP